MRTRVRAHARYIEETHFAGVLFVRLGPHSRMINMARYLCVFMLDISNHTAVSRTDTLCLSQSIDKARYFELFADRVQVDHECRPGIGLSSCVTMNTHIFL